MAYSSFEKQVQEAMDRLPVDLQKAIRNVAVVIEDWPGPEAGDPRLDEDGGLYGLYLGVPLPERTADDSGLPPDVIFIYRGPLEEDFPNPGDLAREIEITLVHEVAHYFGLNESQLEKYGYG